MATDEEERQHAVATEFIKLHPEYVPTIANNYKILDWMELRDMKMTLEGLELAYKATICGEPEPKVMSPDLFFKKVVVNKETPAQHLLPLNEIVQMWKPIPTGINGTLASLPEEFLPEYDGWDDWKDSVTGAELNTPKAAPTEKTVAPMPTAWYSGDVVELKTKRRIKDD